MEIFEENQKPIQPQGIKLKVKDQDTKLNPSEKVENSGFKSNEDQLSGETEREQNQELIEKWVEKFLPFEVLDTYALTYEKSKKTNQEKRENQKYKNQLKKAEKNYKGYLKERLDSLLSSGNLDKSSSNEEVFNKIIEIFKSGRHANNLVESLEGYWINKYQNKQIIEKKPLKKKQSEGVGDFNLKNTNKKTSFIPNGSKKSRQQEVLISAQDGDPGGPDDKKPDSNQKEAPKNRKEFFQQFPYPNYVNRKDGADLKILKYDPKNKEVSIYQYQSFVYNKENNSWGPSKERGQEKTLSYQDFLELMKSYSPDKDPEEIEKNPERIKLRGFYINDEGEFFKPKEYLVRRDKEGREEKFIEIEVGRNIKDNKSSIMSSDNYHQFIKRGGFSFYNSGKEMEETFNEKLKKLKQEVENFKIFGIFYHSGEGKYLVKIKKPDQKVEYVSFKKLLDMAEEDKENLKNSDEEEKESKKNIKKEEDLEETGNENEERDLASELENLKKNFDRGELDFIEEVLEGYVKDYRKELKENLEKQKNILKDENLLKKIENKYLEYFWEEKIGETLDSIDDIIDLTKKEIVVQYLKLKQKI